MPLQQLHDLALRLGALALPWLAVELRRGGRPWLAAEESARLADDPLILRELSVGTYDGLIELADLASFEPGAELPPTLRALWRARRHDHARQAIDELMERLGARGTLRLYPDRHHLLLHETTREAVFADCLSWLTSAGRAARPPLSGAGAASVEGCPDLALGGEQQRGQHDQEQHHLEAGLLARLERRLGRPRSGRW